MMAENYFVLTRKPDDIQSGTYATVDKEGLHVIQFFQEKEDAIRYNLQLEALGMDLHISETPADNVDKFCDIVGCAYSVVEPGEVVIPRLEIMQNSLEGLLGFK